MQFAISYIVPRLFTRPDFAAQLRVKVDLRPLMIAIYGPETRKETKRSKEEVVAGKPGDE